MKEREIRKKAIKELKELGYICWYPPKVRWKKEGDIFGVFDLVATKENIIRFIQLTTTPNLSARRKKIQNWMRENKIKWSAEVWAYNKKKKVFKKEEIGV